MMSRTARLLKDGSYYYVQTQSYKNQKVFKMDSDYEQYIKMLRKYKQRFAISIYAYCLTPAATYLVVHPSQSHKLPSFMQCMNQAYALFFNRRYNGIGKVWGQRYKSILIDNDHNLLGTVKSVEFIPVKEDRTPSPFGYQWSSCANRILGVGGLIDPLPLSEISVSEVLLHKN
ncbi:MAG: transposase [Candidatus Omnitrophica bacterium]|nr:transposase [Candidatus Omnitrophota bacterium]MCK5177997.1 transposase [Candidatus Omnitrophota bacterium]